MPNGFLRNSKQDKKMTEETKIFVRTEIKTEFSDMQKEQDRKWQDFRDEVLDKIRPQFTSAQITGLLITMLSMMVGAVIYVESIKQQSQNNKEQFEKHEVIKAQETAILNTKIEKIFVLATETNNTVIALKTKGETEKELANQKRRSENFFNQK